MNIACVHLGLARALADLGHTVRELRPAAGIVQVAPMLDGFKPDLFIQQETLGPRTLIADLPAVTCPKVFWSVDTHQNSFWHQCYGRLFDLVCTTQQHWQPRLRKLGLPACTWLPWYGLARTLVPWEGRGQGMAFAGRLSPERPIRSWFVDLLAEIGPLDVRQDLNFSAMLDFYEHSRVVPNESLFGEVNFRLFEAASCGCAVLNPALPGLDELFVPGEEVAVYRDGAELADWAGRLRRDDLLARSLGLRAWERVRRDHLPVHRAATLLDAAEKAGSNAAAGRGADVAWWLTLYQLADEGRLGLGPDFLLQGGAGLPVTDEVLATLLRLRAIGGAEGFLRQAVPVAETGQYASSLDVNLAGSLGALRHDDIPLSRLFFQRHRLHAAPQAADPGHSALSICLAWARELQRFGRLFRPGFVFDPHVHLPASALECLVLASTHAPQELDVYREITRILAAESGWDGLRIKALSHLSLHHGRDWRLGLELGLADCRAFRVRQGVEEIAAARAEARRQGQEGRFDRSLAVRDESGQIRALLQGAAAATNPTS